MKTQDMVIGAAALLLLALFMGWVHLPTGSGSTTTTTTSIQWSTTTTTLLEQPMPGSPWSAVVEIDRDCSDTDLGENFMSKGTVKVGDRSFDDSCVDWFTVNEFSCTEDGIATSRYVDCRYLSTGVVRDDFGCAWGACTNDAVTLGVWRALNQF